MKFIKKHKMTTIIIIVFVLFVIIGTQAIKILFPNVGSPVYGNRLDGIEDVKIKKEVYQNIENTLKEEGIATNVDNVTKGKLVKLIITVVDDASLDAAKLVGSKSLTFFNEEQLNFYDFQIYIKKNNKEITNFPIIGYKHHTNKDLTWTKDR